MKQCKQDALEWLSGTSRDFREVCALANLDPEFVRRQARIALKRKSLWRKYNKNSYTGRKKK